MKTLSSSRQKGFSLVEIIISIAVLALLSLFVIQAFLVSERLNQRAADLDIATGLAVDGLERFKASPQDILAAYELTADGAYQQISTFDSAWQPAPESKAAFIFTSQVQQQGDLWLIKQTIRQEEKLLLELSASKYIPAGPEGGASQ